MQNCELLAQRQVFGDEARARLDCREECPDQRLQERKHGRQHAIVSDEGQPRFGRGFSRRLTAAPCRKPSDEYLATTPAQPPEKAYFDSNVEVGFFSSWFLP